MGKVWGLLIAILIVAFLARRSPSDVADMLGDALFGILTFLGSLANHMPQSAG